MFFRSKMAMNGLRIVFVAGSGYALYQLFKFLRDYTKTITGVREPQVGIPLTFGPGDKDTGGKPPPVIIPPTEPGPPPVVVNPPTPRPPSTGGPHLPPTGGIDPTPNFPEGYNDNPLRFRF
jgi:hypothetical protein